MSPFDPQEHHRRSIRLPGYDYSRSGAYFVTIVTQGRECLFGEVVGGEMRLNVCGQAVQWEWRSLAQRFTYLVLGAYVVMPNHFHGILVFHDVGATRLEVTNRFAGKASLHNGMLDEHDGSPLPCGPKPASLGAIIGQFKSRVTKRVWKMPSFAHVPIWQRNYYEHIIRNEHDMDIKSNYIESNPCRWADDDENPAKISPLAERYSHSP